MDSAVKTPNSYYFFHVFVWGMYSWIHTGESFATEKITTGNTSQQDFGTRKVYCVSNVTFHAESKYAIKIFPSPTVLVQWPF